jgi:hypothetical protein
MPDEIQINSIEAHPFEAGGLYLAATAYKSDNFRPYLFRSTDYGKSWKKITDGIADDHFARVIRSDSTRPGLLFAGTERGSYVSFDDGGNWKAMQLNLPVVPVTDMAVKEGNLVVATQGRGFWIFDDLAMLRQVEDDSFEQAVRLFRPSPAWRLANKSTDKPGHRGRNPADGVVLRYWLREDLPEDTAIELVIADADGNTIRTFTRKPAKEEEDVEPTLGDDERTLTAKAGLNRFEWNMRYPSVEKFEKLVLWNDELEGPRAVPGDYTATLDINGQSQTVGLEIRPDPRVDAAPADLQAQFDFTWGINRKLTQTHQAITQIRATRSQLEAIEKRVEGQEQYNDLVEAAATLKEQLKGIEETLYQTKMEARQDPLNFPIRLNDKLASVMWSASFGDHPPSASTIAVRDELVGAIDEQLAKLESVLDSGLASFNALVARSQLPAVTVKN